jgi:hypothetical protein
MVFAKAKNETVEMEPGLKRKAARGVHLMGAFCPTPAILYRTANTE